jgi:hypothetical protein
MSRHHDEACVHYLIAAVDWHLMRGPTGHERVEDGGRFADFIVGQLTVEGVCPQSCVVGELLKSNFQVGS